MNAADAVSSACYAGALYRVWTALVLGDLDDAAAAKQLEELATACPELGDMCRALACVVVSGDRALEVHLFRQIERRAGTPIEFGPAVWRYDPVTGAPLRRYPAAA